MTPAQLREGFESTRFVQLNHAMSVHFGHSPVIVLLSAGEDHRRSRYAQIQDIVYTLTHIGRCVTLVTNDERFAKAAHLTAHVARLPLIRTPSPLWCDMIAPLMVVRPDQSNRNKSQNEK